MFHVISEREYFFTFCLPPCKITGQDGISIEKEGPVHKLLIDEVQDSHAGKYKFEAGGVRTEASIFVEGKSSQA